MGVVYNEQLQECNVVALRACVFGCKVTKSKEVIRITMEVESNSKSEIHEAQTILR
jgi:hypothetical protein